MRRALGLVAAAAAVAVVAASAAVGQRRQRDLEASPLPAASNPGPRGLAAAFAFLEARGAARRRGGGDPPPRPGETVLLAAPRAALGDEEAEALLAHAAAGGTVIWLRGGADQPALDARLATGGGAGGGDGLPLAPHPLASGLVLRGGDRTVTSDGAGALAVSGGRAGALAVSVAVGRGEVLVLAGPDALENARVAEAGGPTLLARLAARGTTVFDERFLASGGGPAPLARAALLGAALQALLAAVVLALAVGPRLGAIRPPPDPRAARTARDYLRSLAVLYRRAGAEAELAASAWRALRRAVERRTGVAARLPDAEAARRLAARSPPSADALRRGAAALEAGGRGVLLEVTRAAAEAEAALGGRGTSARDGDGDAAARIAISDGRPPL